MAKADATEFINPHDDQVTFNKPDGTAENFTHDFDSFAGIDEMMTGTTKGAGGTVGLYHANQRTLIGFGGRRIGSYPASVCAKIRIVATLDEFGFFHKMRYYTEESAGHKYVKLSSQHWEI